MQKEAPSFSCFWQVLKRARLRGCASLHMYLHFLHQNKPSRFFPHHPWLLSWGDEVVVLLQNWLFHQMKAPNICSSHPPLMTQVFIMWWPFCLNQGCFWSVNLGFSCFFLFLRQWVKDWLQGHLWQHRYLLWRLSLDWLGQQHEDPEDLCTVEKKRDCTV